MYSLQNALGLPWGLCLVGRVWKASKWRRPGGILIRCMNHLPVKETHYGHLWLQPHSSGHYLKLKTMSGNWDVDRPGHLWLQAQLTLHQYSQVPIRVPRRQTWRCRLTSQLLHTQLQTIPALAHRKSMKPEEPHQAVVLDMLPTPLALLELFFKQQCKTYVSIFCFSLFYTLVNFLAGL